MDSQSRSVFLSFWMVLLALFGAAPGFAEPTGGFYAGEAGLSPAERAGREIWYKATAGNDRFHTYTFQQRVGVLIDWYRVLAADARNDRFQAWGLMNDPDCCKPGDPNCPAKSLEETYGFDWCPGDEALLQYVGKTGYRDPACDFNDAPVAAEDVHGPNDQRQSACDLKFGTSTGALGVRKFPNPKFKAEAWRKLNGGKLGSWEGYNKKLSADPAVSDSKASHLIDGSIEPPFLVGMSCGACHIAFDPLNPPADPNHPKWENLRGAVGNQYSRFSEIMVSGMPGDSLEWQVFSHARPGTTDTSAVPTDQVNNPGTINAIINLTQRPTHDNQDVIRWRKVKSCEGGESKTCWCEPTREGKCWQQGLKAEAIHNILKGGEDSVGPLEAIQRVYMNIGSCSEQCWVNHLTDLRQIDPEQRGYGQTPFNIGQCRRDCPNFRAIEDRLGDVLAFLASREAHQTDLFQARKLPDAQTLEQQLNTDFGENAVARGREVFASNCARCHSSQAEPFAGRDFAETTPVGIRKDWMGNDKAIPASEVGTYRCRSLHSNHMAGHVWQEYASETYRARAADTNLADRNGGGRGYYRNISLLNAWAYAPFMHNNALGPEVCGKPINRANDFYRASYVDAAGKLLNDQPPCLPYDPSVEGRYNVFKMSMESLLNPSARIPKVTVLDQPIQLDVGPKLWDGEKEAKLFGMTIEIPKGTPAGLLGSFRHKDFVRDLILSKADPAKLKARVSEHLPPAEVDGAIAEIGKMVEEIKKDPKQVIKITGQRLPLLTKLYSSCTADVENVGHRFGEDLSAQDKAALTAFMATL
jgi:hypothetical protein